MININTSNIINPLASHGTARLLGQKDVFSSLQALYLIESFSWSESCIFIDISSRNAFFSLSQSTYYEKFGTHNYLVSVKCLRMWLWIYLTKSFHNSSGKSISIISDFVQLLGKGVLSLSIFPLLWYKGTIGYMVNLFFTFNTWRCLEYLFWC